MSGPHALDGAVVAAYFVLLLGLACWVARQKQASAMSVRNHCTVYVGYTGLLLTFGNRTSRGMHPEEMLPCPR